jgi:argininosuccinate lyase
MKPWGGRFTERTNPLLERFASSIGFDHLLFREDIEGSKAHAEMLEKIGILSEAEKEAILKGLDEIRNEIEVGELPFSDALEDIHMHVETRLIEKIGDPGRKLHTGRSRNDQVALDMRLFLRKGLRDLRERLTGLLESLVERADKEKRVIMPGYTHLQRAQAVTFGHYLMAYYYMIKRDRERIDNALSAMDVLPLGAGALAGSTIPLERGLVAEKLGFGRVSENSMDTVADRDFVLDGIYCSAMIMLHLSRFAEDLVIYSTQEFAFVDLPDELCTGSSLMPHKKNPDSLELVRGKAARVIGDLFSLFTLLKGLPLTYNRDLQEDKEPLFHGIETVKDAVSIVELCVRGMSLRRERMEQAVVESYMPAVEMAEYLTVKGVPFREAHRITGQIVKECEQRGIFLRDLALAEMRVFSEVFDEDVYTHLDARNILASRKTGGAAAFGEIERQIDAEKRYLNNR